MLRCQEPGDNQDTEEDVKQHSDTRNKWQNIILSLIWFSLAPVTHDTDHYFGVVTIDQL